MPAFCAERPSLPPGVSFRLMWVGLVEGLVSERVIAGGAAESLSGREFPGYGLDEDTPDRVMVSRTGRLTYAGRHQK